MKEPSFSGPSQHGWGKSMLTLCLTPHPIPLPVEGRGDSPWAIRSASERRAPARCVSYGRVFVPGRVWAFHGVTSLSPQRGEGRGEGWERPVPSFANQSFGPASGCVSRLHDLHKRPDVPGIPSCFPAFQIQNRSASPPFLTLAKPPGPCYTSPTYADLSAPVHAR